MGRRGKEGTNPHAAILPRLPPACPEGNRRACHSEESAEGGRAKNPPHQRRSSLANHPLEFGETAADKNVRATKKKEKGKVGQAFLSANQPTGRVWINKTQYFEGVPKQVWEFHIGGYQVCEKWLKDRQAKGGKNPRPGRVLTDEDIAHYQKIVVALNETIRLMQEIDEVIEFLNGFNVGPGLRQIGDRCVPHGVWDDLARVESGPDNTASECLLH
ncbi:MAG: hypothetical protein IH793_11890, partial [Acidobacteria bacterium]|nr:hypothetical protein [Acidobacteriota bacterium]